MAVRAVVSSGEEAFATHLRAVGIPFEREYRFHPERKWRFDFAFPEHKVAVEIEGGVWSHGRHTRGSGFVKDCDKYNSAAILGWRVLRFTPSEHVNTGLALEAVEHILGEPIREHR